MKFEDFRDVIENEFDDIEAGRIEPSSSIADYIDLNSLNILVISLAIEFQYDKTIEFEEIRKATTFDELYALVIS